MAGDSRNPGAGRYEGQGEPEGKKPSRQHKTERDVLGENLPGYGPPAPHGERGIDEGNKP